MCKYVSYKYDFLGILFVIQGSGQPMQQYILIDKILN